MRAAIAAALLAALLAAWIAAAGWARRRLRAEAAPAPEPPPPSPPWKAAGRRADGMYEARNGTYIYACASPFDYQPGRHMMMRPVAWRDSPPTMHIETWALHTEPGRGNPTGTRTTLKLDDAEPGRVTGSITFPAPTPPLTYRPTAYDPPAQAPALKLTPDIVPERPPAEPSAAYLARRQHDRSRPPVPPPAD